MALVKYNPFRGFDALAKRMNDFISDFEQDSFFRDLNFGSSRFLPVTDIKEDEKHIYITAEIPGISKENIKVTINDDNILQIRGEKKHEEKKENESYIRMERVFGEFTRSFVLPDNVKEDKIKAKFENGVLNITLEKVEPSKPKEIEVSIN
ncbi:Hsp20/alpha crystallin family protein [Bacteroidetes/Chlorobi group bacterium ChocPot_Mid]|jgi:HSP20 family protein|nr:MAG: Hsp20/alpha crystallin family protein [Bacteroidetes/Chlorobi group bacterium ChocPot_Mid]